MMIMQAQKMKAMRQQRAQMEYQQYEAYQQGQQQGQNQAGNAPPSYQQQIDARNQAIAQAILKARSQAMPANGAPVEYAQAPSSVDVPQPPDVPEPSSLSQPASGASGTGEVVDLYEVWKKLDKRSTIWTAISDDKAKLLTVSEYIGRFQKEGVKINEPPAHYVQLIDELARQNPQMLERPFGELIQILAIMDYDFDNGMDKDALAKAVLGPQGYEQNKQRFSQQQ
ncbi:MAG: hypothetical protein KGI24_08920 [Candidatus Omnitrophica bacterium]|nr:hypothetical protein [Candidatus Omnitrophota bacterium]